MTNWIHDLIRGAAKLSGMDTVGEIRNKHNVTIEQFRSGKRILKRTYHNVVTNAGKAVDAGLFNGVLTTTFTRIALGVGTAAATTGDTALGSEITTSGGARNTATATRVSTAVSNDTAQLVQTWAFTGSFAVTESGIFDSATAGDMATRQTFSAVNVVSGDSLQVTWKVQKS